MRKDAKAAKAAGVKPVAHYCAADPFRSMVMLVIGTDVDACIGKLACVMDVPEATILDEYAEEMSGQTFGDGAPDDRFCHCGKCISRHDGHDVLLWFPRFPHASALAHECLHAVQAVLRGCGVEDGNGEADAYLLSSLFQHFLKVLAEDVKREYGDAAAIEP